MTEKILKVNQEDTKKYYLLINFSDCLLNLTLVNYNKTTKEINVLGNEEVYTRELKDGFIKNMEEVQLKLKHGIEKLKDITKSDILDKDNLHVICTIASMLGDQITSQGVLNFVGSEITEDNIEKLIQSALYNGNIPVEMMAINYKANSFKMDGVTITNPINMSGKRLEVDLDIQTIEKNHFNNFKKVINECGLDIGYIHFDGSNVVESVLTMEDMDYGTVVVELGLEFTKVIFVKNNRILKSKKLPIAVNKIVTEIASCYGLKYLEALKIYQNIDFIMDYSKNDGFFEIEMSSKNVKTIDLKVIKEIVSTGLRGVLVAMKDEIGEVGKLDQFKHGILLINNTKFNEGFNDIVVDVFKDEVIAIKKYKDILKNNKKIFGLDILENKFDILGDVGFINKEIQYKFDFKNLRYPRQARSNIQKIEKIDLKHLEDFGKSEVVINKKKSVFGSIKKTIAELW